jgi:hypothetical protein
MRRNHRVGPRPRDACQIASTSIVGPTTRKYSWYRVRCRPIRRRPGILSLLAATPSAGAAATRARARCSSVRKRSGELGRCRRHHSSMRSTSLLARRWKTTWKPVIVPSADARTALRRAPALHDPPLPLVPRARSSRSHRDRRALRRRVRARRLRLRLVAVHRDRRAPLALAHERHSW